MKVIDLLKKIANDIDVPPKNIKYKDKYFEYKLWLEPSKYAYVEKGTNNTLEEYCCFYDLNDEVEIIEEEQKIPEKIDVWYDPIKDTKLERHDTDTSIEILAAMCDDLKDKYNEIINYLKSKGE